MEQLGINEVQDVVALGLAVGKLIDNVSGGIKLSSIGAVIGVIRKAPAAISAIKSGKLIPELKDLDANEKATLNQYVVDNFSISNATLQAAIDKGFSIALDVAELLKMF